MKTYIFWGGVILLLLHFTDTCLAAVAGVMEVGTSYLQYDLTAGDPDSSHQLGSACSTDTTIEEDMVLFVNPSNVGIESKNSKHAVMGFINEDTFTDQPEVCVRIEAHLSATDSISASLGYSWLKLQTNLLDETVMNYASFRFTNYTCLLADYGGMTSVALISSLRHTESNVDITRMQRLHYDIVWVTDVRENTYELCWQDIEARNESHASVNVDMLTIVKTDDKSAGYVAGTIEFGWPGEDEHSGFCINVPFTTAWEIPPVMFATLENPGAASSVTDQSAGVFIWVENVGSGTFEICGSHITSIPATIRKGSPFKIHYFGVPPAIIGGVAPPDPSHEPLEAFLSLKMSLYCDDRFYGGVSEWPCDFEDDTDQVLFLGWVAEGLEIPRESVQIDGYFNPYYPSYGSNTDYYSILTYNVKFWAVNPQAAFDTFQAKMNAVYDEDIGIFNYDSDIWREYVLLVDYDNSDSRDVMTKAFVESTFRIGCVKSIVVTSCSKTCDSGASGTSTVTEYCDSNVLSEYALDCNVAPCSGSQQIQPLSIVDEALIGSGNWNSVIPPDWDLPSLTPGPAPGPAPDDPDNGGGKEANGASASVGSNDAAMIATIVMGVFVGLFVIGCIGYFVVKSSKGRSSFGNIGTISSKL